MRLPKLNGLYGVASDGRGTITLTFTSEDERKHYVPLEAGVLNAMLGPILSVVNEARDANGKTIDLQALTLTAMRPLVLEDGAAGLELHLDGMPLRIALPQGSILPIIAALTELEGMTGASGSEGRPH